MTEIAISANNLSKRYQIGQLHQRHDTLRDSLAAIFSRRMQKERAFHQQGSSTIWAIKDISFEVPNGEVLGIIGRNGAGKSTLLKVLAQITEPTTGQAKIYGRVGSLLEVGTGFHYELTGRENIYFSGAMLGMSRKEIDRKFDEIVDFSGVGKFIDTPIKRYSSGMNVRLGFAVAAFLEPEILLVDEVLAVGDVAFQNKCLGKMSDVVKSGRTILFVSHNLAAVANLCNRTLLIEDGKMSMIGETDEVINAYFKSFQSLSTQELHMLPRRAGNGRLKFTEIQILDKSGDRVAQPRSGEEIVVELKYESAENLLGRPVNVSIGFYNIFGQPLFLCRSDFVGADFSSLASKGTVYCLIPRLPLPPGEFRINLHCEIDGMVADWIESARLINVGEGDFYGTGRLPERARGDLLVDHSWFSSLDKIQYLGD